MMAKMNRSGVLPAVRFCNRDGLYSERDGGAGLGKFPKTGMLRQTDGRVKRQVKIRLDSWLGVREGVTAWIRFGGNC